MIPFLSILQAVGSFLLGLIKKPAFWLCVAVLVLAAVCSIQHKNLRKTQEERARLEENQASLLLDIEKRRTENGELVASVQALTLKGEELSLLVPKYEKEIKDLKIALKNAKSLAHVETETSITVTTPLQPELQPQDEKPASPEPPAESFTPREFFWEDEWITIRGKVYQDTVICSFVNRDTLTLIAHYQKRRCLFAKGRKGKLIKYDVKTKNPHTDIKGLEYIEIIE